MKRVAIAALLVAFATACDAAPRSLGPPTTVTVSETVQVDGAPVLEPDGIGGVRLGLTVARLEATGEVGADVTTPEFSCPIRELETVRGWVGIEDGVAVDIRVETAARTPEGLRIGDSRARMREVYPDVEQTPHGFVRLSAPGIRERFFFRDAGETLTGIGLTAEGHGCLN
ncbi:MAG: hypothetical protein HOV94_24770 [Saccharothrix sp.]|nr:hypothetical protein [Saccharothrix sp.]